MSNDERTPDPDWPRGFEEHELLQRRRMAKLPLREKLRWLEEAHELVRRLSGSRESRGG